MYSYYVNFVILRIILDVEFLETRSNKILVDVIIIQYSWSNFLDIKVIRLIKLLRQR